MRNADAVVACPVPTVMTELVGPVQITDRATIAEIARFRVRVWRHSGIELGSGPEHEAWTDLHDQHATHFAIWDGARLVASARLCLHERIEDVPDYERLRKVVHGWPVLPAPIACFNRLVVHPLFRRRGLAEALDRVRLSTAKAMGARSVFLTVPAYRVNAVKRLGFTVTCRAAAPHLAEDTRHGGDYVVYKLL